MKNTGRKLFLLSFILAVLAAGAVYLYLDSLQVEEVTIETEQIMIAAVDIPPRTLISKDMIAYKEVPKEAVFGGFITEANDIIGKYTKEPIYQNEQFVADKIIMAVEEELSLRIRGNHRAVTVALNGEKGVADMIKPGDYVDIFMFLPELKENNQIVRPNVVKLLLQNIEVLSIDKELFRDAANREEIPSTYHVTLSVPIFDVESLLLAEDIGELELTLRPLEGDFLYTSEGTIWEELMLDDFYRMKDLFPQYDVMPVIGAVVEDNGFNYDKYIYYTVRYGDTLRSISAQFFGTEEYYELIKQINRIEDEDAIIAGTGIKIPVLEDDGGVLFDGEN